MDRQHFIFEALQEIPIEECSIKTEVTEEYILPQTIKTEVIDEDVLPHTIKTEVIEEHILPQTIKTEVIEEDVLPQTSQEDDTKPEDPLEPTLRKLALDSQAKLMVLNVHKYFHKFRLLRAKETGEDMNVNKVVAEATGVSESTVKKLVADYRNKGIEGAISGPVKNKIRKRKNDVVVEVGKKTKKKQQRKK